MTMMERIRERQNRKIIEKKDRERKDAIAGDSSDEAYENISRFTSARATLRKSIPMIIFGALLAFVEYEIIGGLYTVASLAIYIPLMYFYTKSVIPVNGKYILHVTTHKASMRITRYLIPDEIFEQMQFDVPLIPGMVQFNGHDTYLVTKVWKLENGVIWKVKLAFLHENVLEFALHETVLKKAIHFAQNTALQSAELDVLKGFMATQEGTRQRKEEIELLDRAYKDSPLEMKRRIQELEDKLSDYMRRNKDLIYGPDYDNQDELETDEEEIEE